MALLTQQSIIIESEFILSGQRIQGIIDEILPDKIIIRISVANLAIEQGIWLKISFWDSQSSYEFESITLTKKDIGTPTVTISKPDKIGKVITRNYDRIELNISGTLIEKNGLIRQKCLINDLSAGGVRITALKGKKIGDIVKLIFTIPGEERFEEFAGFIVWIKDFKEKLAQYGVEFGAIPEMRRTKIDRFVREKLYAKEEE